MLDSRIRNCNSVILSSYDFNISCCTLFSVSAAFRASSSLSFLFCSSAALTAATPCAIMVFSSPDCWLMISLLIDEYLAFVSFIAACASIILRRCSSAVYVRFPFASICSFFASSISISICFIFSMMERLFLAAALRSAKLLVWSDIMALVSSNSRFISEKGRIISVSLLYRSRSACASSRAASAAAFVSGEIRRSFSNSSTTFLLTISIALTTPVNRLVIWSANRPNITWNGANEAFIEVASSELRFINFSMAAIMAMTTERINTIGLAFKTALNAFTPVIPPVMVFTSPPVAPESPPVCDTVFSRSPA